MVAHILTLLALATAPAPDGSSAVRVEAQVSATIVRAVTLRDIRIEADQRERVSARPPRLCNDDAQPDCRLIVYDLP